MDSRSVKTDKSQGDFDGQFGSLFYLELILLSVICISFYCDIILSLMSVRNRFRGFVVLKSLEIINCRERNFESTLSVLTWKI
jgi:hypothetical protein